MKKYGLKPEYIKRIRPNVAYKRIEDNIKPNLDNISTPKECDCPEHNEPLHIKEPLLASLNKKWFDSIRSHTRFIALTEKVKALEY